VTIRDSGSDYDFNPPTAPEPAKAGRPADARGKAEQFIREALVEENDQIANDLILEWEKAKGTSKTFWRAVEDMEKAGELTRDGGAGTRKQTVLHLVRPDLEPDPDRPF
jgi:hypothetical protein